MVERRYEAAGEEIVLRHKDEPTDTKYGNHAAWFDDGSTAVYLKTAYDNHDRFPEWLQERMSDDLIDASLEELEALMAFLADNHLLVCKCGRLFPKDNAVSTGFAGVKCGVCSSDDAHCPESDDNTHDMKVVSGRHNARKATKRKCQNCGYKNQSPPTG
jgi:hypothetical protein